MSGKERKSGLGVKLDVSKLYYTKREEVGKEKMREGRGRKRARGREAERGREGGRGREQQSLPMQF